MSGFAAALAEALRGNGPETIALMRVLAEAKKEAEARNALAAARDAPSGAEASRAARLLALWDAHPGAWSAVRDTIGRISHRRSEADAATTLAYWAATFDRLVATAPEASVALYSLGSPDLLAAATDEVVERMDQWGLVGPDRDILDLGCGIARVAQSLAPRVRHVLGLDVSAGMVAEARRRCARLGNVELRQSDGTGLEGIPDDSQDLVLAADVFPYLVEAGLAVAAVHVAEAARVLRSHGALLILNYSYRGDLEADRRDLAAQAAARFVIERAGTRDFALWDGTTFLLRLRPHG